MTAPPPDSSLAVLHAAVHAGLDAHWRHVLVAATACDFAAALAAHARFEHLLVAHASLEEDLVMPRWAARAEHPRASGPELLDAEHRKLETLTMQAGRTLDDLRALPGDEGRGALVDRLPELLRVRALLDHHGDRETRFVYPTLEADLRAAAVLGDADAGPLLDALHEALDPAPFALHPPEAAP